MKLVLVHFVMCVAVSCRAQIPPPPKAPSTPKVVELWYNENKKYDTTLYWHLNDYEPENKHHKRMDLESIKNTFNIKNGQLYRRNDSIVNNTKINCKIYESVSLSIVVDKGKPLSDYYYNIKEIYPQCSQDDTRQHLKTHLNIFKEGEGEWQDFYYKIYQHSHVDRPLKEKGKVKSYFKHGKWVYYNVDGSIDSTKVYSTSDSVDIRFPHCLFNKVEPCYSDKRKIVYTEPFNKRIEEEDLTVPFSQIDQAPKFLRYPMKAVIMGRECYKDKIKPFSDGDIKKEMLMAHFKRECFNIKMKTFFEEKANRSNVKTKERVTVFAWFTILKDGTIADINVKGKTKELEEETVRLIKELPKMEAGRYNGKKVNVTYSIPIYFKTFDKTL